MEALPGLWSLSPAGGLLGLIVLLGYFLATGKLVTRREVEARIAAVEKGHTERVNAIEKGHELVLAEKDGRIKEFGLREERLVQRGDDWRAAYQLESQTTDVLQRTLIPANLEAVQGLQKLITDLPRPADGGHTGGVEES